MKRSQEGPDQRVMYWLLILAWCFHIVGCGNQISRRRPGHDYQYTMDRHSLTNQQSQSLLLQDFSSQTRKAVFFFFLFNPCGRDWTQLICLIYNDRNQFNQRDKSTNRGLILLIYNLSWSKTSERQVDKIFSWQVGGWEIVCSNDRLTWLMTELRTHTVSHYLGHFGFETLHNHFWIHLDSARAVPKKVDYNRKRFQTTLKLK